MEKIKVLVPVGCRSDAGLSKPIIKRLRKHPKFECITTSLNPAVFYGSYGHVEQVIWDEKPDLVLCVGDRIEMCAAAAAAFHNGVKIGHVYAGVVSDPLATLDDINRHCISLWADICFCEDYISTLKVADLWSTIGKTNINLDKFEYEKIGIYEVGITHLDDLEVNESLIPSEAYDLILMNTTTTIEDPINMFIPNKKTIRIGGNPDGKSHSIGVDIDYDNLPRPQFLGLLKNCTRFITNSSAAYYEAPHFLAPKQIIMVGERNKNRSTPQKLETGASDKIVQILSEYFRDKYVWEEIVEKRKRGDFNDNL